jgi:D-3-phosphoglycerate dehydrogenase
LKLHIAETEDFSKEVIALLQNHFEVTTGSIEKGKLKQKLQEVDVFWFRLAYQINAEVIDESSRCKYLVSPVTGIDHLDERLCDKMGISIICLRGEREFLKEVRATAEHTMLLTMMLMRNTVPAVIDVNQKFWRRDLFRGFELFQKKVGIVGYGRLGKIVAEYFHTFGCEVGFYDVETKDHPNYIKQFDSLERCIEGSEIISIHVPYNESTHHLFDGSIFAKFDNKKWLINTSRGGIVNDSVLLKLLQEGKIAGAALDVLYGEPNISNNPLIDYAKTHRNLIITPHIGGCTYESFEKTEKFIAQKLLRAISIEEKFKS